MNILFAFNQSESYSIFIASKKYLILLLEKNTLMASGNITGFMSIKAYCKSFMKKKNNSDEK